MDKYVLEFIGAQSAAVVGLAVPESGLGQEAEEDFFDRMDEEHMEDGGEFYVQISIYT